MLNATMYKFALIVILFLTFCGFTQAGRGKPNIFNLKLNCKVQNSL